jgi:hypothetical protein
MPIINGGSDRMVMSIFSRQRDAVEYITEVLDLSKARLNGDQYSLRITMLVEHIQVSRIGRMLSGYAKNLCSRLVI